MTNFINRELSWLEFNMRVLQEAKSSQNPLLERIKYLSIVSSNLDEFFMVRVASIQDQINTGYDKKDPSGLLPEEVMKQISARAHSMVGQQYKVFNQIFNSLPDDLRLRIKMCIRDSHRAGVAGGDGVYQKGFPEVCGSPGTYRL